MVGINNAYTAHGGFEEKTKRGKDGSIIPFINGPLLYAKTGHTKRYHKKAAGKKLLAIDLDDSELTSFIESLGKQSRIRSKSSIEFVIYNDVPRYTARGNVVYYAKFVEYGYTNAWSGKWIEGRRMYAKIRKRIKRKLVENLKKMPRIYLLKNLEKAFEDTVIWVKEELERMSGPSDGQDEKMKKKDSRNEDIHMKDYWKYFKMKDGQIVKSKGDR